MLKPEFSVDIILIISTINITPIKANLFELILLITQNYKTRLT